MEFKVKHDEKNQQFSIEKNKEEGILKYRKLDEQTLDYYTTFVPKNLRNQGIAAQLTNYALQYARDNNYQIIPSCSYVKVYIDAHPRYQSLVKQPD